MNIAGIVLAAGGSTRMGSPKALLQIGNETFVGRLVRVLSTHCTSVIVVLGHGAEAIQEQIGPIRGATIVVNPTPEQGQLSSLQTGLRKVDSTAEAVLFCPVDCPAVAESTVEKLCGAGPWPAAPSQAAPVLTRPRYHGKNGHPVLLSTILIEPMLALPPTASAKELIRANAERTLFIDVEDPAVLGDIDTPEDYARLSRYETVA